MVYSRQCVFHIFRHGLILSQVVGLEILFDEGILYPIIIFGHIALCLLWVHVFTTLITTLLTHLAINSFLGSALLSCRPPLNVPIFQSRWNGEIRVAVGLFEVITQLCVVQALFHCRSITLPMLFYYISDVIIHVLQLSYLRFRPQSLRGAAFLVLIPVLLVSPFIILVVLAERKLDSFALLFLFIGAGGHIAKASIKCFQDNSISQRTKERGFQWPPWLTLSFVLIVTSIFIAFGLEGLVLVSRGGLEKLRAELHPIFILPSIVLGALSAAEYSGFECKNSSKPGDIKSTDSQVDYETSKATMDAVAAFVCTFLLFLQTPTWVQIISYGITAIFGTLAIFIFCKNIEQQIEFQWAEIVENENHELEDCSATRKLLDNEEISVKRRRSGFRGRFYNFTLKLWVLFAGLLGTKLLLERPSQNKPADQISIPGASFPNHRSMDIVISYYKENLDGVASFLDQVKAIPQIWELSPNIIVYGKYNESDISDIKARAGANEVTILPNKGREGGTYLHHIIDRWDDLAKHTLFIQAETHARNRVIHRLKHYFDPERTGMLDLGYRELRGCKCLDCRDEYSWRDLTGFIPDLMAQAHHIKCDESTRVAISYKGQFVVSSKRIRAVKKSLYEDINEKLVGENRVIIGDREEDVIDAPAFGYSLERSWNILFQCADLTGSRDICPGLTTMNTAFGDFNKAQPEDCGCIDE